MYISRFGIDQNPFGSTPNPRYFVTSHTHRRALAELLYSMQSQRGLSIIVGESGSGKSTLVNVAIASTNEEMNIIRIDFSQNSREDMVDYLAAELDIDESSLGKRMREIKNRIVSDFLRGQRHVILYEYTQNLNDDVLNFLLELTEITVANVKPISVILTGDHYVKEIISRHSKAMNSTIFLSELQSLTADETAEYVISRLKHSGVKGELFTQNALDKVFEFSHGVPARINQLCEVAILSAVSEDKSLVDKEDVSEAIKKLDWDDSVQSSKDVDILHESTAFQQVLLEYDEDGSSHSFKLQKKTTRLGRDAVNDFIIDDEKASRFHAKIVRNGERFFLLDLLSSNRTLLNSMPIKSAMLKDRDMIKIGDKEFRVSISSDSQKSAA